LKGNLAGTDAPIPPSPAGGSRASRLRHGAPAAFVRYANVWEDADVLCAALAPVGRGGRLLSIASAGDNVLAMLTLDPAEIVAVDISQAQLACLELRLVAFRHLADPELLAFLGVLPSPNRLATYRDLRCALSPPAREFWEAKERDIAVGVIHGGRFERYLRGFRRFLMPLIHPDRTVAALGQPRSPGEQEQFYDRTWDTWRWRCLFRLFFSRAVMGRLGRDPSSFEQVSGPVGARLLARTRRALTALPVRSNPYLAYILTGSYPPEARPRYLRPEHMKTIRARLERVRLVHGDVRERTEGRYDGFNLSDLFETMSPAEHDQAYSALVDHAHPRARLVYWNMLVHRPCPASQTSRVRALPGLAETLHARASAWFYQALHVDEVVAEGVR
jgi:S-adenosylmethionine-diacylglycerol 3-amino-3-carboxypropyl transferase